MAGAAVMGFEVGASVQNHENFLIEFAASDEKQPAVTLTFETRSGGQP
jgi:hypothetical protein